MIDRASRKALIAQRAAVLGEPPPPPPPKLYRRRGPKLAHGSTFGAHEGSIEDAIEDLGVSIKERG